MPSVWLTHGKQELYVASFLRLAFHIVLSTSARLIKLLNRQGLVWSSTV